VVLCYFEYSNKFILKTPVMGINCRWLQVFRKFGKCNLVATNFIFTLRPVRLPAWILKLIWIETSANSSVYSSWVLRVNVALDHTHWYNRQDSPGREIGPSQKLVPDNTQHSYEIDIYIPGNPNKQADADPRLIPRGHRARHSEELKWRSDQDTLDILPVCVYCDELNTSHINVR